LVQKNDLLSIDGCILGPIIGSLLYALGGFAVPFYVIGSIAMCSAVLTWLILPKSITISRSSSTSTSAPRTDSEDTSESNEDDKTPILSHDRGCHQQEDLSITAVFKNIEVLLPFIDAFVCFLGDGMAQAMMEPHLKKDANATQSQVALTFFILGGAFTIATPIVGHVRVEMNSLNHYL